MSVVRSLLVKIGFVTDKQAVNSANKAVDNFKLRFSLIASAATYAFSKVTSFFNNVATKTLDASDLAKSLNVTLGEILAIQKAASNFRINDKEITGVFSRLSDLLFGFRTKTNLELNFLKSGVGNFAIDANESATTLFQKFLVGLRNVATQSERSRLAKNIFGKDLGDRIARISENLEDFNGDIEKYLQNPLDVEASIEKLNNYTKAVSELSNAFDNLATNLVVSVGPIITSVLEGLTFVLDGFTKSYNAIYELIGNNNSKPIKKLLVNDLNNLSKFLGTDNVKFNNFKDIQDTAKVIGQGIFNSVTDTGNGSELISRSRAGAFVGSPSIEINNEFNVPAGAFQDQDASWITDSMRSAVQEGVEDAWRSIQYNNPQVE